MGKIKSKQVKRGAHQLLDEGVPFSQDFSKNKKILGKEMPSKKMRNKMAGYLSRFMKQRKKEVEELKTE